MTLIDVTRSTEKEKEVSRFLWRIVQKHYPGSVNIQNTSLMAQRLFDMARSMYNEIEMEVENKNMEFFLSKDQEIERLQAEIRELKGLPPLPPIAIA